MTVKQLLAGLVLCIGISQLPAKELKVLTIGNNSSFSVGKSLPMIVHSFPDHKLELTSTYINGCTFEKHVANIKQAEADVKKGIYTVAVRNSDNPTRPVEFKANLVDLLKNQKYDIITIQQASMKSWDWSSYEPFAGNLIQYIRKFQPNAEIVIQQTWAFRADAPHFKKRNFSQNDMYKMLCKANKQLAEKYQLREIPMGDAVQLFRKNSPVKYQIPKKKDGISESSFFRRGCGRSFSLAQRPEVRRKHFAYRLQRVESRWTVYAGLPVVWFPLR